MKTITVFTPTFNRAYVLPKLYKSLLAQESVDFVWLIVDDGSTDNTRSLVEGWMGDEKIDIIYVKQNNMGMIAAHNVAISMLNTELFVCVDSDDFLTDGAIAKILRTWETVKDVDGCGGIVGLDVSRSGEIIGDRFPSCLQYTKFKEIRFRHKISGDKKYVISREAIEFAGRYPEIEGERFPAVSYLYRLIDQKYSLYVMNVPLCVVEYLPDGNTSNKIYHYKSNPNAYMKFRMVCMDEPYNLREKFWSAAHYVSSAIFARKQQLIFTNRHFIFTVMAIPLGVTMWLGFSLKMWLGSKRGI